MSSQLCLAITFLDPRFHGRRDGGEPEWPPSPLRLFQAIVAAAAAPTGRIDDRTAEALRWFERLPPPRITAPPARTGEPYRLSVPNNAMDIVAKAWAGGNYGGAGDANPAKHRTMKTIRPTHMLGGDQVRYAWTLPEPMTQEDRRHAEAIRDAVRAVVAVGWGVDLVVGHGEIVQTSPNTDTPDPHVEQWEPGSQQSGSPLRAPKPGTLNALLSRHDAFLSRVTSAGFTPVPPLSVYSVVHYRRPGDQPLRPFAAFVLRPVGAGASFASFPQRRAVHVAAMLRHAACEAAKNDRDDAGWRTEEWGRCFVAGHGRDRSDSRRAKNDNSPRFSYLSLPSITPIGVGRINRVIIAEPFGGDGRAAQWASRRLAGAELIDKDTGECAAVLEPAAPGDTVLGRYVASSRGGRTWASVSPIILPGYDDGKPAKRDRLLFECLRHAGFDAEAVESIESRPVSWFARAESFARFKRPDYLRALPAVHLRVRLKRPISGPISLGAGRHCGLGVMAKDWE